MNILLILNDAPYGSEKTYNALRLARTLQQEPPQTQVRIFLLADAVTAALPNQQTPQGYYNIARMVSSIVTQGGAVGMCGTCAEARGLREQTLLSGVEWSTMSQLARWVAEADKVLTF